MTPVTDAQLKEAVGAFDFEGELLTCEGYGSGHINDTYLLEFQIDGMGRMRVILQRINSEIFESPQELMENITHVTDYIRDEVRAEGGDVFREVLTLIKDRDGRSYYQDSLGDYWRSYIFITCATSYDSADTPELFYESALAFGHFQYQLADFPAATLHETIKNFHNTEERFARFRQVLKEDKLGRAKDAQREIEFVLAREELSRVLNTAQRNGEIPLRVTHNDTKLNNIMLDDKTGKGICVIDLDTVMPGLAVNDYGDSIRFGASTAAEDERDLSRVECDMELFRTYTEGFLKGCNGRLTPREIELLPTGAEVMTFECGIRFLTDYLEGDTYFKIHRPEHNLDRCRTQFKLVADMEKKWDQMQQIVAAV